VIFSRDANHRHSTARARFGTGAAAACQHRSRAGVAGRDPRQQHGAFEGRRVSRAGAFRQRRARPDLRRDRPADRARPDRQPGHPEKSVRPGRGAGRDRRRAVSGAARRGGGDDHQRRTLRPHHPRSAFAPRADHDRAGRRDRGVPPRSRRSGRGADRARRTETVRVGDDRRGGRRLSSFRQRADPGDRSRTGRVQA